MTLNSLQYKYQMKGKPKELNMEKTMVDVMRQLEKELGVKEGLAMYEWYCVTYSLNAGDKVPSTILYEVFGE